MNKFMGTPKNCFFQKQKFSFRFLSFEPAKRFAYLMHHVFICVCISIINVSGLLSAGRSYPINARLKLNLSEHVVHQVRQPDDGRCPP